MEESKQNIKLFTPQAGWKVHPDLRSRMIQEADEKDTNLGDLANQIIALHFGIPYEPRARRSSPADGDKHQLNFTMPSDLERVMGSVYPGRKMADGIRYILCQHYGLRVPEKPKMTRRRGVQPAAA